MVQQENKVLLHACCAVCLGHSIEKLLEKDYQPIVFFFNPNIFPNAEYQRRKNELIEFCELKKYKYIIEEDMSNEVWREFIKGHEHAPEKGERCNLCFQYRLQKTFEKARKLGIKQITTTLTISPHKISRNIFEIGKKICKNSEINFLEIDFKKENGFLLTNKIAEKYGFYRQNYCGCEFSIKKQKNA